MEVRDYGWSARLRLGAVLALVIVFASSTAALASPPTASQITVPADGTVLPLAEQPLTGAGAQTIQVEGTVTGASVGESVEVGCYFTEANGTAEAYMLLNREGKPVHLKVQSGGRISTAELVGEESAELSSIAGPEKAKPPTQPCTLRAVALGTSPSSSSLSRFAGPRVAPSMLFYSSLAEPETAYDLTAKTTTLRGGWVWNSAGSCGPSGFLVDPTTLQRQEVAWGAFCEGNLEQAALGGGASLLVDNVIAYTTYGAFLIYEKEEAKHPAKLGFIKQATASLEERSGSLTETWTEPLVRCEAEGGGTVATVNPSPAECPKLEPTGVDLVRSVTTGEDGLQATVTDRFESEDGNSHSISIIYGEEDNSTEGKIKEEPLYRFPGQSTFTSKGGPSPSFGAKSPATVYFETSAAHQEREGLINPREAITLSPSPNRVHFVSPELFEIEYSNAVVSSSEPLTITHVLSQALTQVEVERLAKVSEESAREAPEVSIAQPANGSISSSSSITVSGTTQAGSPEYPYATLTVNGQAVAPGPNGAWSTNVPLREGANTIEAVATTARGKSTTSSITVTYIPPSTNNGGGGNGGNTAPSSGSAGTAGFKASSSGSTPPAVAALAGTPSGRNGRVSVPVSCTGRSGQRCRFTVLVTVRERLHGRSVVGLLARAPTTTSRSVTIASGQFTLSAGQSQVLLVALDRAGAALLAHHRALPAALHLTLVAEPGSTTVTGRMLTITPAPPHRHK
jgi:Glucodextranase, domain B